MEYKYLSGYSDNIYFRVNAFSHHDEALKEWNEILEECAKRKAIAKEKVATRKVAWQEFLDLKHKYGVELSTRVVSNLKSAFNCYSDYAWYPSLKAWYVTDSGDIAKADPANGYVEHFEEAFNAAKNFYERNIEKEKAKNDTLKKAIQYCIENSMEWTVSNAVAKAYNHMAEKMRFDLEGKTIEIDCCDECNQWTVGEHRCSCGNRRMELIIEGVFPNLYYYAEGY